MSNANKAAQSREEKVAAAIEWMGERWSIHPKNRIKKLKTPLLIEKTAQPKVLKRGGL